MFESLQQQMSPSHAIRDSTFPICKLNGRVRSDVRTFSRSEHFCPRPRPHPAVLLKLCIYGYLNRIQSSRRLEREAQRNVELMWLTGRLAPDFKTISNFREDNGKAIRHVCRQLVVVYQQLDLFSDAVVASFLGFVFSRLSQPSAKPDQVATHHCGSRQMARCRMSDCTLFSKLNPPPVDCELATWNCTEWSFIGFEE